jgi:hypothetical protein
VGLADNDNEPQVVWIDNQDPDFDDGWMGRLMKVGSFSGGPTVLATDKLPTDVIIVDGQVYLAGESLRRFPLAGGEPTVLQQNLSWALVADASRVYAASLNEDLGATITAFSRSTTASPGFPPRGLRTYFLRVTITGTLPAVRAWE